MPGLSRRKANARQVPNLELSDTDISRRSEQAPENAKECADFEHMPNRNNHRSRRSEMSNGRMVSSSPKRMLEDDIEKSTPKRKRKGLIVNEVEEEEDEEEEEVDDAEQTVEKENANSQLSPRFVIDSDDEVATFEEEQADGQVFGSKSQFERGLRIREEAEIDVEKTLEGEPGHIQEISLNNFMCHENFSIKFGPRINFVIGPNGSGKSAILSAIILGLGARASTTTRGSGLNSFIKTGETRAKIVIKLCNYINSQEKSEAYLPEKYGKSITVERTIYSSGASNYKIRDEANKVISEKKEEVDNITKHFQIFVDNPICVLTQEVSKNFLNSKNPKDKFKFFVKATQLEDVKNDYEIANNNKDNSAALMKEKNETIELLKKRLKDEHRKVKIIEVVKNSVEQLNQLSKEAMWSLLNEKKTDFENLFDKMEELKKDMAKCTKSVDIENQTISLLQNKKQELTDRFQNFESYIEKCRDDFQQASSKQENARAALVIKERNLQQSKMQHSIICKDVFYLEKRIEGIESQLEGVGSINIEAEIERVKGEISEINRSEAEARQKKNSLIAFKEELRQEKDKIIAEDRRLRALINSHKAEIERFNRGRSNQLDRYGQGNYQELVKNVESRINEGKFKKRPYGPLGCYINLQDKSAAFAAETLLKSQLSAFVVDNYDDMRTLKGICNQVMGTRFKHPEIIVREYGPLHDVSRFEVRSPRFQNFLQILNIKEPEVANCLIDHSKIERILYIPNYNDAQNLLIDAENVPLNCFQAYTQNGDLMYPQTNSTDYKCYPNRKSTIAKILVEDSSSAIEQHHRAIQEVNQSISDLNEKHKEFAKKLDENKKECDLAEQSCNELRMNLPKKEKELHDLKKKSQMKPVEVIVLREDISKKMEEKNEIEDEIKLLTEERDTVHKTFIECQEDATAKEQASIEAAHSRQPLRIEIEKVEADLKMKASVITGFNKKKEMLSNNLSEVESKRKKIEEELDESRKLALEKTGSVIESARKYNEIKDEIRRIRLIIEQNPAMMDQQNQNEIIQKYQELYRLVDRASSEMKKLADYINLLSNSIADRKTAYFNLRHFVHQVVNYFFEFVLQQKGFTGHIDVNFVDIETEHDHRKAKKAHTLDIVIFPRDKKQFEPQNNQASSQSANANDDDETGGPIADTIYGSTKSLSGGERSYSTVAFIIALWQISASPFRLLDEVDVFMDLVTRKISIDMLVTFATKRSSKQFIFLSPLKLQQIEHPECVRVFQLPEIVRN